jgi:hypothetical protein
MLGPAQWPTRCTRTHRRRNRCRTRRITRCRRRLPTQWIVRRWRWGRYHGASRLHLGPLAAVGCLHRGAPATEEEVSLAARDSATAPPNTPTGRSASLLPHSSPGTPPSPRALSSCVYLVEPSMLLAPGLQIGDHKGSTGCEVAYAFWKH